MHLSDPVQTSSRWSRDRLAVKAKGAVLDVLLRLRADAALAPMLRGRASVFMLHRFRDDEHGVVGHDPEVIRRALRHLRARGYEFVALNDLVRRLAGDGPPLRRSVCFTIDDGYLEQATVASPLFAEFDCPVTTFVTSGFLDRTLWFWWDRIEHIVQHTARPSVRVSLSDRELGYSLSDVSSREHARASIVAYCKTIPDATKHEVISAVAAAAEVEIPAIAPKAYQPMSWNDLRRAEELGMTFGPHTVTHPILSRTSDSQCRHELRESWVRLKAEARRPVPVFCYPNGQFTDFGVRETSLLRDIGLSAAVVGEPGYADPAAFQAGDHAPYRIRRFGFPDDLATLVQVASGIERLKRVVRGEVDS